MTLPPTHSEVVPAEQLRGAVDALREAAKQLARIGSPAEREDGASRAFVVVNDALDRLGRR